ncbi:MAG: hypothetical protein Q7R32_06230 [Dehalococcoidia bacterium]|nr:hypothetical protein [Dehalococcoidia bacterium]
MSDRLSLDLFDNALDFLVSSSGHALSDSQSDWKYALLHLAAAVELLLKTRLEQEHWSLLFADVDKADLTKLHSGDFKSIDFEGACARLAKIASVSIDEADLQHLDQLRKLRNRVQHFEIHVELEQIKSLLDRGINFFVGFMQENLPDRLAAHDPRFERIYGHLRELESFVETRLESIDHELKRAPDLVECGWCWQETLILGSGDPRCAFCGFTMPASEYVEYLGEGSTGGECLVCGEQTLSFVLVHNEFGYDHCVSCGTRQSMCLRCRHRSVGVNDVCPECGYNP